MEQESLAPLIEFVGRKFDAVDQRFDQMATQEAVESQLAETRRHFEVVAERLESRVRLVAEGIAEVSQRIDRRAQEITAKIEEESAETRAMSRFSYAQPDGRVQSLERSYALLEERVAGLESRPA